MLCSKHWGISSSNGTVLNRPLSESPMSQFTVTLMYQQTSMSLMKFSLFFLSQNSGTTRCRHSHTWKVSSIGKTFLIIKMTSPWTWWRLKSPASVVYWGANQRKHQSPASLAFVRAIHRWPVNSPHKWPVTRNIFPFGDVIMTTLVTSQHWHLQAECLKFLQFNKSVPFLWMLKLLKLMLHS